MNGQLTIIGSFIVRWNVWGPLVNVGGATVVLSLREPGTSRRNPVYPCPGSNRGNLAPWPADCVDNLRLKFIRDAKAHSR
jgi:hypothetical protein